MRRASFSNKLALTILSSLTDLSFLVGTDFVLFEAGTEVSYADQMNVSRRRINSVRTCNHLCRPS
jgi:hypothetical protein